MKNINIQYNSNSNNEALILIKYNKQINKSHVNILIKKFMEILNSYIGAKTTTNYHIKKVINNTIVIPVFAYTTEENKILFTDLITKRVKSIINFLENFNWENVNTSYLWIVRSLQILDINIVDSFTIETVYDNVDYKPFKDKLLIKSPKIEYPTMKRIKLNDDSIISVLIDPYLDDYGLFINLSIPFDEMSMSYNALHLYEHLVTKAWNDLSGKELIELNGATYPTGASFVYSIHKTIDSLKEYINHALKWMCKSRELKFWNDMKDDINFETIRTISETRLDRTLISMGRSDFKAYELNYDKSIFHYWSNKPFNILISTNIDIPNFNVEILNKLVDKYKQQNVKRPPYIIFKHIPLDVLRMKEITGFHTQKKTIEEIKEIFKQKNFESEDFFGIDCILNTDKEDLSVFNSILHPLLFLNRYYTDEELNDYLKNHILAYSSKLYSNTTVQYKHNLSYINNID